MEIREIKAKESCFCLTVVEPSRICGGKVIGIKLKRRSHHFVELMLKRNWKSTLQKDLRLDCPFVLKVFI